MPPLPEGEQYVSGPRRFEPQRFAEWRSQALNLLRSALPEGHTYVLEFEERVVKTEEEHVKSGVGILTALREDLDRGYLAGLRQLIASEVFTDFLEIADHLLEAGYFHAAASVCGAVLEDALRRELVSRGFKPGRNLESLNQTCLDNSLYSPLAFKQVKVWIDVRNAADHGEFEKVDRHLVESMLRDLPAFFRRDLGLP